MKPSNDIDTTYRMYQRDMFTSGLVARIGSAAMLVWLAIKNFADIETGEAWPSVRKLMEMTGHASATVQGALDTLIGAHLLREVRREGQHVVYVARERMDVRIGRRVICTIVIDYVPASMRERLASLRAAAEDDNFDAANVWADVEMLPGPGFTYDPIKKAFVAKLRADEVPDQVLPGAEGVLFPELDPVLPKRSGRGGWRPGSGRKAQLPKD